MVDAYVSDGKAKAGTSKNDTDGVCKTALERYSRSLERERDNIHNAYENMAFVWDDEQWDARVKRERLDEDRPCLTINRCPQFVHQVTGDMRQSKPAIKAVPVDSGSDKDTAETINGLVRYVENRSDALSIYTSAADSQVVAGIGAWRVTKEYASDSTFNQELRIAGVDDPIAIAWDPDAILPTREDAKWCIVPVDMSREAFKENYPDAPIEDFDDLNNASTTHGWFDKDFVRVAEYWVKKPITRTLALFKDGRIVDLTNKDDDEVQALSAGAVKIEDRPGFKVCRYVITAAHVLEGPTDWPGRYIPIVPVVGEEIRIGRKIVRRGLIHSAKDAQRMFNYFCSAQAEVTALQPKAPFIGTVKNFEKYEVEWGQANTKALPFLPYEPDPKNGGQAPQRVAPPVSSQGISEGIALAAENMKAVIGIYDASLGQRSNEVSGVAIRARQREGDTGTFVYIDNWSRAIRHTGKILIDLIPHVYDTERTIRIMGEDGKIDLKEINKSVGVVQVDPLTGEQVTQPNIQNDVTSGSYDVALETGPSYTTKRQEAKEGMIEFIRSAPSTAPVVLDLVAKAQDWPLADEFGKRLEAVAPAPIQKLIAGQKKERGEEEQGQEPTPAEMMEQQVKEMMIKLEIENKQLENEKLKAEISRIMSEANAPPQQPAAPEADPLSAIKAQGEMTRNQIEAEKGQRDIVLKDQEIDLKELDKQLRLLQLDLQRMGAIHKQETHTVGMMRSDESHHANIGQMSALKPEMASA